MMLKKDDRCSRSVAYSHVVAGEDGDAKHPEHRDHENEHRTAGVPIAERRFSLVVCCCEALIVPLHKSRFQHDAGCEGAEDGGRKREADGVPGAHEGEEVDEVRQEVHEVVVDHLAEDGVAGRGAEVCEQVARQRHEAADAREDHKHLQ
jgi:hypothetical protein